MRIFRKPSWFPTLSALSLVLLCMIAAPVRADMPNMQTLQGAWAGSDGTNSVILMFMGAGCALGMNGQQMHGTWQLTGNRIDMRFQNGRTLAYTADIQGDVLVLDGYMRLARQNLPGMTQLPQQQPQGGWGQPQQPQQQPQGGWGQPQQPQQQPQGGWGQPQHPQQSAPGPLEGRWVWVRSNPGLSMGFTFSGDRFSSWMTGRIQVESTGTYTLSDARLILRHETGPDAGKTDNLACAMHGNQLYIGVRQGEPPIVFVRQ